MSSAKSIPKWVKYVCAILFILLAIYITYNLLTPSQYKQESFQDALQNTIMRKWTSSVILFGTVSLTSYGLNIAGADYVIYTIPASVSNLLSTVQSYSNLPGITALETVLSHKNMKYILDMGIAITQPTNSTDIKYIPQIIENQYHTLTMFNDQKSNMRYVALKPYYLSVNTIPYYYMSYILYYITPAQNTTLETLFTDKMTADGSVRSTPNGITGAPTSFITSTQLPLTGKVNTSDTTTVPIRPLFFRSDFLIRDTNTSNYKKLIDDNNTGGSDHSINYSNISLNIFPSLTFNSIYDKYVNNSAYANWNFGPDMTKFLSVSFRTEAMAGMSFTPAIYCSYLYILDGGIKKYLSITESNKITKTYGPVVLTTNIKQAVKVNIDLSSNNKCMRYSIPAGPNNLSKPYVLGVLFVNSLVSDQLNNMLCFFEADSTYTPVVLGSDDLTSLKNKTKMHNDRLPWYLFENSGNGTTSFIYGSGAYNTYLTVSGSVLSMRTGTSRNPTPAPLIIYNNLFQLDIKYKYANAPVSNLYKVPNYNEYVYLDTSPINQLTNIAYSRLVYYIPQQSFPQANHSMSNGAITAINNRGTNVLMTSPEFYHYNITTNSSNITLHDYTINALTCPQTITIGASLPKYTPTIETLLSSYTPSIGTWQIKSPTHPAVNNALVNRYENKANPAVHMFRLLDTGEFVAYIYNPVDSGLGLVPGSIDINAQNTDMAFPGKFIYYKNLVRFVYNSSTKTYTITEVPKTDRLLYNVNMTVELYVPPTTTKPVLETPVTTKPVIPPTETTTTTTQYISPAETTPVISTEYIIKPVEMAPAIPTEYTPPVETTTTTEYIPSEEQPPVNTEYYKPGRAGIPST